MKLDDDFTSGFEDGKFDRLKPFLKVLVVIILLAGATWGTFAYFGSTDKKEDVNKTYSSDSAKQAEDVDVKLAECIAGANSKNAIPEESDGDFWPKIIARYDAQLGCYDQYPDANGTTARSSTEMARENAIDSSGKYKDTYLSSNSYNYTPSDNSSTSSSRKNSNSTTPQSPSNVTQPTADSDTPNEWELNKAEFDSVVTCANSAAANNPIQGAYGSPSYYQQKITQLEAQLACTNGAKYSMAQQRRSQYQSEIATNKARYNDSINPDSSSYYPNSY